MPKRNKIRYKPAAPKLPAFPLTGVVYLQYRDDEAIPHAEKGDVMFFPSVEALHTIYQGDYGRTGFSGYFKVDVSDGKNWQPLSLSTLFPDREHHFSKTERSLDTYMLCAEKVANLKGTLLVRTYREHYDFLDAE